MESNVKAYFAECYVIDEHTAKEVFDVIRSRPGVMKPQMEKAANGEGWSVMAGFVDLPHEQHCVGYVANKFGDKVSWR